MWSASSTRCCSGCRLRASGKSCLADRQEDARMNVAEIRKDFPILDRRGTRQAPRLPRQCGHISKASSVIDAIKAYYLSYNANVHRAIHALGEQATAAYEEARAKVARFINAAVGAEYRLGEKRQRSHQSRRLRFGDGKTWAKGTKSWSAPWSTTATSCPGRSWPSRGELALKFFNLTPEGGLIWEIWTSCLPTDEARGDHPCVQCAGHDQSGRGIAERPTRWVALSSSTGLKARPICQSMSQRSIAISSSFRRIRCADPWALGCSTARKRSWTRWILSSLAER